ncbi:MAG: prolyl oligopeptidase family serine peptidase [Hydrogenophaga sp.]|nr:prolyl oligopeptidase family serine peptidase [Hydrogenophaga sp.]
MRKSLVFAVMAITVMLLSGCEKADLSSPDRLAYPVTQRQSATEILHGTAVSDPYRWLETNTDDSAENSAAISNWLAAQQSLSSQYFAQLPSGTDLRDTLVRLWNFERREAPRRFGERWFLFRNTGGEDYYTLAMQTDPGAEPETLLDPTTWSDSQNLLAAVSISPNGRFLAWLQTNAQGGERLWQLRDLDAENATPDIALDWLDVEDIVWRSDSEGFYYSASVLEGDSAATAINYHALGQDDSSSSDVPQFLSDNLLRVLAAIDGRWLIALEEGASARVILLDETRPESSPAVVGELEQGALQYLEERDGRLFFLSTLNSSAGSIVAINPDQNGAMSLTVIVAAEQRQILRALTLKNGVLVEYLDAGVSVLERIATDGSRHSLALPGQGRISSLYHGEHDDEVLYAFSTLTTPGVVFRLNTATGVEHTVFAPELSFNPADFVVERFDVPAAEAGGIPVWIAGRRDRVRAADSNLLLEVYGGFGISMDTGFSTVRMAWMEQGGVYAIAAVRGGGELGPHWHEQAKGSDKYRSVHDLLTVARHLHETGNVAPGRLAVMGASHGAMLVAAAMNADPTQFAAAVLSAGPMDMLRLAELGGADSWREEYGNVSVPEQFAALFDYSPYHNVQSGAVYPSVLLVTAEADNVVAPAHSFKYAARLQAEADPSRPVLLRTQPGTDHLDTGTVDQLIDRYVERWAFLQHELGR